MKDAGLTNRITLLPCDGNRSLGLRESLVFGVVGEVISKESSDAECNAYNAGNGKGNFTKMIKRRYPDS